MKRLAAAIKGNRINYIQMLPMMTSTSTVSSHANITSEIRFDNHVRMEEALLRDLTVGGDVYTIVDARAIKDARYIAESNNIEYIEYNYVNKNDKENVITIRLPHEKAHDYFLKATIDSIGDKNKDLIRYYGLFAIEAKIDEKGDIDDSAYHKDMEIYRRFKSYLNDKIDEAMLYIEKEFYMVEGLHMLSTTSGLNPNQKRDLEKCMTNLSNKEL